MNYKIKCKILNYKIVKRNRRYASWHWNGQDFGGVRPQSIGNLSRNRQI